MQKLASFLFFKKINKNIDKSNKNQLKRVFLHFYIFLNMSTKKFLIKLKILIKKPRKKIFIVL